MDPQLGITSVCNIGLAGLVPFTMCMITVAKIAANVGAMTLTVLFNSNFNDEFFSFAPIHQHRSRHASIFDTKLMSGPCGVKY